MDRAATSPTAGHTSSEDKPATATRFTNIEKEILFTLFHQHEDIIDIKYRKNSRNKKNYLSVRECWEKIVQEYNRNPHITTPRNLKQVQKFWLNVRLRKKYPSNSNISTEIIKSEGEIQIPAETENSTKEETEEYETLEELQSSVDGVDDAQDQCFNIDQISTEKLTLNDLLEFKNSAPREEIVVTRSDPVITNAKKAVPSPQPFQQRLSRCMENEFRRSPCCTNSHHHVSESVADRLNYFKLMEAELRYKEQEVRLQQRKLELLKARTELRNMRELHQLQVEEMKIKLRILSGEEKSVRNKKGES